MGCTYNIPPGTMESRLQWNKQDIYLLKIISINQIGRDFNLMEHRTDNTQHCDLLFRAFIGGGNLLGRSNRFMHTGGNKQVKESQNITSCSSYSMTKAITCFPIYKMSKHARNAIVYSRGLILEGSRGPETQRTNVYGSLKLCGKA